MKHEHKYVIGKSKKVSVCQCGRFRHEGEFTPIVETFKVETWLPIFSGFYGTIWESDSTEESEIEHINERRREKGLTPVTWNDIEWDYEGYRQAVAARVTRDVSKRLEELGCIQKGEFQKLKSPREYNFANDSIEVCYILDDFNTQKILAYLRDNREPFEKYLKDTYTSRDGFIPHYSNQVADWLGDINDTVKHTHKLGAVLNFILLNEEGPDYEIQLYENAAANGCTLEAKNYTELTEVK